MRKIAVTIPEAVELSGIGRSSLYKLFSEGKLTPRKAGKRTLILIAELDTYLESLPAGGRDECSLKRETRERWQAHTGQKTSKHLRAHLTSWNLTRTRYPFKSRTPRP